MCRYGRVARKHYEALVSGNYTARFLPLEDVFWLTEGKPVRAATRPCAPLFHGTFQIAAAYIATIAPVEDCTKLLLPPLSGCTEGMSAWEAQQCAVPAPVEKRRRKAAALSKG